MNGTSGRLATRAGLKTRARGRTRLVGAAVAASATAALVWSATGSAAVTAPHFINVFPSRDFVHIEGYNAGDKVTVEVAHDPALITSQSNAGQVASATGTVGADGIFEVNHVGGACWSTFTPDIRPGDTVTVRNATSKAVLDSMVVQNVAGGRPIQTAPDTLEVHGAARDAAGNPPDVTLLGSRLISPDRFAANGGKRNLNAPALTYDAPGSTQWTATYAGLTQADIDTALAADTSATWTVAAAGGAPLEGTSQETGGNAIAGPTTGCTAPLEKVQVAGSETTPPTQPTNVAWDLNGTPNTVTLSWDASSDPDSTPTATGVVSYSVLRDDKDGKGPLAVATVQSPDGQAPVPVTFIDKNVPTGSHVYSIVATDGANNDSAPGLSTPVDTTANPAADPGVPVNEPPTGTHSIIGFPARDFISADGYTDAAKVDIQVIRGGNIIASAADIVPAGATGLVEVNHPGGGCWAGVTPYLSAGDKIRTVAKDAAGKTIAVDQTTLANVTAERPVETSPTSIAIHGTAVGPDGKQIPIDHLENRIIASSANPFSINGKRAIRASSVPGANEGLLSYDSATSTRWTATYTNLPAADVALALQSESRGMWLGQNPLTTAEATIFENGDQVAGGPGAPCAAPPAQQPQVTLSTTALDMGTVNAAANPRSPVTKPVTITNTGTAPLHVDHAYVAGADATSFKVNGGCDTRTIAVNGTCTVTVTFDTKNTGPTSASLNFADDAKIVGFQSVAITGTGVAGNATVTPTSLSFGTVTAGSPKSLTVTVTNPANAQTFDPKPVIDSSSPARADYAVDTTAPGSCTSKVAAGASCTITVTFNPTATGTRTATLTLNSSGASTKTSVPLSGTGQGSAFTLAPSPVSFGTITRNTTKAQTVTVKNSGTIAFKVTAAAVTGSTAYTVPAGQACVGTTLAAGKTCNLTVNFTPTAAQAYTGTLVVTGDNSSLPKTVSATLTGSGK